MHDQAAAYVLNALDADEAKAFERHVQLCPGCEADLEPLRIAAAALAFAGELPAPRSALRRRVLGADAVVLRFRRRWIAPLASAAALAACAALVVGLTDVQRQPAGVAFNLPAAPAGKVYEIWFVRQGMQSAPDWPTAGELTWPTSPVAPTSRSRSSLPAARPDRRDRYS